MRDASADFPLPVGPTTATVSPGAARNVTSLSASPPPGYANETPSNLTSPGAGAPAADAEPQGADGSWRMTSSTLREDASRSGISLAAPAPTTTDDRTADA